LFSPETLTLIYDYGGLVIGFIILMVSTFLLPAKIRWYVLTAGLTLIVFRAYQIFDTRKKLKEADAERENLREKHGELEDWLEKLRTENQVLRVEKAGIESERDRLRKESGQLNDTAEANRERKRQLDAESDKLLQQSKAVQDKRDQQISAIDRAIELKRKFAI